DARRRWRERRRHHPRRRTRNPTRRPRAHLRSVLHDEGRRERHGARAGDQPDGRQRARRADRRREPAQRGCHLPNHSPRACAGGEAGCCRRLSAARLHPPSPSRTDGEGGMEAAEETAPAVAAVPPAQVGGRRQLARRAGVVSVAVLASRVLGLVREQVFAVFFGAGRELDAFITAFRIPNLFRDLFAEGALSAAFVTTFTQRLEQDGEKAAWRLANLVLHALIVVVGGLVLLGMIGSPWLVDLIAPGFRTVPGKSELTVHLTRILFPFLLFVALAAVAMGMLNAKERFGVPASASSFFNLGSVVAGLACAWW